jgi:hypothetical protein
MLTSSALRLDAPELGGEVPPDLSEVGRKDVKDAFVQHLQGAGGQECEALIQVYFR